MNLLVPFMSSLKYLSLFEERLQWKMILIAMLYEEFLTQYHYIILTHCDRIVIVNGKIQRNRGIKNH